MLINNTIFQVELIEILTELQRQLQINKILLLQVIKDSGNDLMVQCPYHSQGQEKRPSAGIRKSDGKFHCFRCNCTHELPEVISYCLGYENDILGIQGWKWLQKNFLSLGVEERKDVILNYSRSSNNNIDNNVYVSEEELDQYRYIHPYMYQRKLTDEIIELFDIGYDAKSNSITFPNLDKNGNCLFVAKRSVKGKAFFYPKDVIKPLYGIYQLYQLKEFPKEVFITESMIDCLYLWRFGKFACALNGLGTSSQFEELNKMSCRKFILATDNDEAGLKARERIRKNLKNKIIMQVVFPQGRKDINELTEDEVRNLEVVF